MAVTCHFHHSLRLPSVAPSIGRPPSLEDLVSSFRALTLTPRVSVCSFCLLFLCAHHITSCVYQFRGRSIVQVPRGECHCEPSKHASQLKYSCHTVRTRRCRQIASLTLPSSYKDGSPRSKAPNSPERSMQSAPPKHGLASPGHRRSRA